MARTHQKLELPKIKSGADCCGCTGCAAICPKDAITMEPDSAGFVYPKLDPNKCIGCMLCEKVCNFIPRSYYPDHDFPKFYGARQKDLKEVVKSRSGGIFPAVAQKILKKNGCVYGVVLTDDFKVKHKRIISETGLDELRGSKYVQSNLTGVFRMVKEDLKQGRQVLFSGTPCQTATLLKFIPKTLHDQLFVVDIVCHGVPGPTYWKEYLRFLEKKQGKKIIRAIFRDKERTNWLRHQELFVFEGDSEPTNVKYHFYNDILFRKSCNVCHFTNLNRPSDLTLADFWGYERTGTYLNDDKKGLSLILVNSVKGAKMFDEIKSELYWFETSKECAMQESLQHPVTRNPKADGFYRAFCRHGFGYAMMKYGNVGIWAGTRRIFNAIIRRLKKLT